MSGGRFILRLETRRGSLAEAQRAPFAELAIEGELTITDNLTGDEWHREADGGWRQTRPAEAAEAAEEQWFQR